MNLAVKVSEMIPTICDPHNHDTNRNNVSDTSQKYAWRQNSYKIISSLNNTSVCIY